jgi:hypothetical protein
MWRSQNGPHGVVTHVVSSEPGIFSATHSRISRPIQGCCPWWRSGMSNCILSSCVLCLVLSLRKSTSFPATPKRWGECGAERHVSVHCWWKVVPAWQTLAPGKNGRGPCSHHFLPLQGRNYVRWRRVWWGRGAAIFKYLCSLDIALQSCCCGFISTVQLSWHFIDSEDNGNLKALVLEFVNTNCPPSIL